MKTTPGRVAISMKSKLFHYFPDVNIGFFMGGVPMYLIREEVLIEIISFLISKLFFAVALELLFKIRLQTLFRASDK